MAYDAHGRLLRMTGLRRNQGPGPVWLVGASFALFGLLFGVWQVALPDLQAALDLSAGALGAELTTGFLAAFPVAFSLAGDVAPARVGTVDGLYHDDWLQWVSARAGPHWRPDRVAGVARGTKHACGCGPSDRRIGARARTPAPVRCTGSLSARDESMRERLRVTRLGSGLHPTQSPR
jgi:hypothetical protein